MAERPDEFDLSAQLRQHLASLRAAGVQWLPAAPATSAPATSAPASAQPRIPPSVAAPAPRIASASAPAATSPEVVSTSLFVPSRDAVDVPPADERRRELTVLAERVAGCTRCTELAAQRTQTVFGVGAVDPELCFVGEAPGFNEDQQGEPFVGEAGQLLNRIIAACGMKREEVYICNIVKCRPPGNRLPSPDEAAHCREYLVRQLELVRPKFICCLGACAAQNLLGTTQSVGRLRGKFQDYQGIPVLVTYHPAYLLRNPAAKKDVWEDMKILLARMGKPIPVGK
jgi:DNA polymerase